MGTFRYAAIVKTDIEDRALAHMQIVVGNKLKRGEPFFFTWREDASLGDGRRSVWIHPYADLEFRFYGSRSPQINHAWLEAMSRAANSTTGLYVLSEPAEMLGELISTA
ncbi:ATP-dependent DNA ligase [Microbacterium marinum]|uniref:DUF7882 family protein n=1 Tax=Microbacterium marinum TaxID=421115 RepID=UPI00384C2AC6